MSDPLKLARMANQIAGFFRAYPEPQAVAGIHDHIAAFWSPRMRADLDAFIAADSGACDPLVVAAVRRPAGAESPTDREAAGPGEMGQLASDAG